MVYLKSRQQSANKWQTSSNEYQRSPHRANWTSVSVSANSPTSASMIEVFLRGRSFLLISCMQKGRSRLRNALCEDSVAIRGFPDRKGFPVILFIVSFNGRSADDDSQHKTFLQGMYSFD